MSVATANVTVLPEQDNKPLAHAGNPVVINLPNNEATLDGSQSKDEVWNHDYYLYSTP